MVNIAMYTSERCTNAIKMDTGNEREIEQHMNIYLTRKHPGYKVQC